MSIDTWASILSAVILALASAFGVWMFRIDRGVTRLSLLAETLRELRDDVELNQRGLWRKLDYHGERITRLETKVDA